MKRTPHKVLRQFGSLVRKPGFWFIVILVLLITIPYYAETITHPSFLTHLMFSLELSRHSFERILFLVPIVWAGFILGWRGSVITSLFAIAIMLPRAIASDTALDDVFEASAVFVIGNVLSVTFFLLRREREHRIRLENAQNELQSSERRFRELFENAHDATSLTDLQGNLIAVNQATVRQMGYTREELLQMNMAALLTPASLQLAREVGRKMLAGEPVQQPYELHLIRKDRSSEAIIEMSSSVVTEAGKAVGFQNIARDVTEERRLEENLRFYLRQAARAQEEERKRISRELHDDTIQALVVLSRQLDNIVTTEKGISEALRQRLEGLWQRIDEVMRGVRRLSQDLRPAALDRLGLMPALNWLATDVATFSGLVTKVTVTGTEHRLPEEVELVLFRIVQEALRNVWRHAQATRADIAVEFTDKRIRIAVTDNGKGYQVPRTIGDLARDGKLGLTGMQERAQLLGGTLSIQSESCKGTCVTVEVPV